MEAQEKNGTAKRRGRPATGQGTQIQVRLQPDLLLLVDRYAAEHGDISRPEAIRRLVELGLKASD